MLQYGLSIRYVSELNNISIFCIKFINCFIYWLIVVVARVIVSLVILIDDMIFV